MISGFGVLMFTGPMTIKGARGAGLRSGSVLILVVLLMVLLSVLGMLFLLMSRLDEMATWSISENRELDSGVEVIVNQINKVLVDDLFGDDDIMFNADASDEYYDYPGAKDAWLAPLEPEIFNNNGTPSDPTDDTYFWRWISDIYGAGAGGITAKIIAEDKPISQMDNFLADADGDGVSDSQWLAVPNITTSKGKTIYAAVRIVDNGGMVNVNTAYRAIPGAWDGSMLSHVNLEGIISTTDWDNGNGLDATTIQRYRYGTVTSGPGAQDFGHYDNDVQYEVDVARRILNPYTISADEAYMPFDISDELELRNRFFLKSPAVTPIETVWPATFDPGTGGVGVQIPYKPNDSDKKIDDWFDKVKPAMDEPGWVPGSAPIVDYNRRHLSTVYNFDRVMVRKVDISGMPPSLRDGQDGWYDWTRWNAPQPELWLYRPVCVNDYWAINNGPTLEQIAGALWLGLDETTAGFDDSPANPPGSTEYNSWSISPEDLVYQLTVNLIDYIDTDPNNTSSEFGGDTMYYGFEQTQRDVYISEICIAKYNNNGTPETYYALGLYNPGTSDVDLSGWQLVINGSTIILDSTSMSGNRTVSQGDVLVIVDSTAATSLQGFNAASVLNGLTFANNDHITLLSPSGRPVDGIFTGDVSGSTSSIPPIGNTNYYNIDRGNRLIDNKYPIWDTSATWPQQPSSATDIGDFTVGDSRHMQLMTRDDGELKTIGEIFNVLGIGASVKGGEYRTLPEWLGAYYNTAGDDLEAITAGRMDAADPNYAKVLNYVTVFNPFNDGVDNDGNGDTDENTELQIAGRININTAPWFVIAQLPWMQYTKGGDNYLRARAIVDSRLADGPYRNITELMRVAEMLNLGSDGNDNDITEQGPDFTPDTVRDDLEERDVIFSRVSNLVTVRSDVFTAYILVRLGIDGPQRRMIGIFDRSGVFSPTDKPKVVALHPVPDPR